LKIRARREPTRANIQAVYPVLNHVIDRRSTVFVLLVFGLLVLVDLNRVSKVVLLVYYYLVVILGAIAIGVLSGLRVLVHRLGEILVATVLLPREKLSVLLVQQGCGIQHLPLGL
jgi:hypothetical protein